MALMILKHMVFIDGGKLKHLTLHSIRFCKAYVFRVYDLYDTKKYPTNTSVGD